VLVSSQSTRLKPRGSNLGSCDPNSSELPFVEINTRIKILKLNSYKSETKNETLKKKTLTHKV
jgi:hypothetical protein